MSVLRHIIRRNLSSPVPSQIRNRYITNSSAIEKSNSRKQHNRSPITSYGIIAALNNQSIIGINGSLPWKHLPQDKAHFVNMTRNKILIIGRKSLFEEDPTGDNVRHVRACVVLSRTMNDYQMSKFQEQMKGPEIKLARSFGEALCVANNLSVANSAEGIDCWVAGGEGIYREALQHSNLQEVNLTHVDLPIDEEVNQLQKDNRVTRFPMDVFRLIGFEEVSRTVDGSCTFCVYKRKE
jgi:dihydrofolate reductase